jgi:hypothetical protein
MGVFGEGGTGKNRFNDATRVVPQNKSVDQATRHGDNRRRRVKQKWTHSPQRCWGERGFIESRRCQLALFRRFLPASSSFQTRSLEEVLNFVSKFKINADSRYIWDDRESSVTGYSHNAVKVLKPGETGYDLNHTLQYQRQSSLQSFGYRASGRRKIKTNHQPVRHQFSL